MHHRHFFKKLFAFFFFSLPFCSSNPMISEGDQQSSCASFESLLEKIEMKDIIEPEPVRNKQLWHQEWSNAQETFQTRPLLKKHFNEATFILNAGLCFFIMRYCWPWINKTFFHSLAGQASRAITPFFFTWLFIEVVFLLGNYSGIAGYDYLQGHVIEYENLNKFIVGRTSFEAMPPELRPVLMHLKDILTEQSHFSHQQIIRGKAKALKKIKKGLRDYYEIFPDKARAESNQKYLLLFLQALFASIALTVYCYQDIYTQHTQ